MNRLLVLLAASVSLSAQWLEYRASGIPRTPDGKPGLSPLAPKIQDDKPDLSGVWGVANSELDPESTRQASQNQFLDIAPDDKNHPYHVLQNKRGMAKRGRARDMPPKTTDPL